MSLMGHKRSLAGQTVSDDRGLRKAAISLTLMGERRALSCISAARPVAGRRAPPRALDGLQSKARAYQGEVEAKTDVESAFLERLETTGMPRMPAPRFPSWRISGRRSSRRSNIRRKSPRENCMVAFTKSDPSPRHCSPRWLKVARGDHLPAANVVPTLPTWPRPSSWR
jgi:hypothetical protein